MELNREDKARLRDLMSDDAWKAVLNALDQTLTELRGRQISGTDAFETLRALHLRDGAVDALFAFFDDLDRQANA